MAKRPPHLDGYGAPRGVRDGIDEGGEDGHLCEVPEMDAACPNVVKLEERRVDTCHVRPNLLQQRWGLGHMAHDLPGNKCKEPDSMTANRARL